MFSTKSRKGGVFLLTVATDTTFGLPILINHPNGKSSAFISQFAYDLENPPLLRAALEPPRNTIITVLDEQGMPLGGAEVRLIIDFGLYRSATTNESGEASFRYPANASITWMDSGVQR